MIDTKELRRKLRSDDLVDHVDIHANVKSVLAELINSLEAAEKERDELRVELNEIRYWTAVAHDTIKALNARIEAAEKERDWHAERCEDAMNECAALRAKIEAMEQQVPVAEWIENRFHQYPQLVWNKKYRVNIGDKLYALPGAKTQGEEK